MKHISIICFFKAFFGISFFSVTFARRMRIRYFYILLLSLFANLQIWADSPKVEPFAFNPKTLQISLLTCSPGKEVWSLFGHTAIRFKNEQTNTYDGNIDIVVNYGMFSFNQPNFVPRFVLGKTDYQMGIIPMELFMNEYAYENRGVTEQVLNLSEKDKEAIAKALLVNYQPENITYRYNFFYNNCTTKARDLIVDHLSSKVTYNNKVANVSFRELTHRYNAVDKWAQLGDDLLLGMKADSPTNRSEQQFLPNNLMYDFATATYNGKPLVSKTNQLLTITPHKEKSGEIDYTPIFPPSPMLCIIIFTFIAFIINLIEVKKVVAFRLWDALLMLITGLMGVVFTIMIFSEHPCVSANGLLLIFNPLSLFFLYPTMKKDKTLKKNLWWRLWAVLIVVGLLVGFIQYYPTPIVIMALFLLLNCGVHVLLEHENKLKTIR